MNTLTPLVHAYLRDRRAEGLCAATLTKHRIVLEDFESTFGRRPLEQLGERAVLRWLEGHTHPSNGRRAWADSTRSVSVSIIRTFARWCERNGQTRPWSAHIPKVRRPTTVVRFVESDDFATTLSAAESSRERLILWLLFGCGLRCVEVSRLRMEDWSRIDGVLRVTGKAMHQREVPVPDAVRQALTDYLAEHPVSSGQIVRRADGCSRGISANTVSSLTRRMLRRAGVKGAPYDGVCAHGMRAAAATAVLESSQDVRIAQALLGHRDLSSTSKYLKRAGVETVRAALAARSDLPPTAA